MFKIRDRISTLLFSKLKINFNRKLTICIESKTKSCAHYNIHCLRSLVSQMDCSSSTFPFILGNDMSHTMRSMAFLPLNRCIYDLRLRKICCNSWLKTFHMPIYRLISIHLKQFLWIIPFACNSANGVNTELLNAVNAVIIIHYVLYLKSSAFRFVGVLFVIIRMPGE